MSKVEQLTAELEKLSEPELARIRDWLDNVLEDQWEFTPEFEAAVSAPSPKQSFGAMIVILGGAPGKKGWLDISTNCVMLGDCGDGSCP